MEEDGATGVFYAVAVEHRQPDTPRKSYSDVREMNATAGRGNYCLRWGGHECGSASGPRGRAARRVRCSAWMLMKVPVRLMWGDVRPTTNLRSLHHALPRRHRRIVRRHRPPRKDPL